MKKNCLFLTLFIFVSFSVQAQLMGETVRKKLTKEYEIILDSAKKSNRIDSVQYILFAQLIQPFVYFEFFPEHYKKMDAEYFKDDNEQARILWLTNNNRDIEILSGFKKQVQLFVDRKDTLLLLNHERFKYEPKEQITLIHKKEFKPALDIIDSVRTYVLNKSSLAYSKKLEETYEKYQNKYFLGYRDRNLLGFFIDGYIEGHKQKKMSKRYDEEKGLLKDPSRGAAIILAPPIIAISSNSINEIKENNNLYGLVQVLGYDIYVGKSFKNYIGLSFIHASPIVATNGLLENSLFGIEAHYSNRLNIGYAISYKEVDNGSETGRINKIFISYALFNKFFKK